MKHCLPLLLACLVFAGCVSTVRHHTTTPEETELFQELRQSVAKAQGSQYEWIVKSLNLPGIVRWKAYLLNEDDVFRNRTDADILNYFIKLKDDIDRGKAWSYRPAHVIIPKAVRKPVIDGIMEPEAWDGALAFSGSYKINTLEMTDPRTTWKIMYDDKYLYFCATFKDDEIGIDYDNPYFKDAFELFVKPSARLDNYIELNVTPDGHRYSTWCVWSGKHPYDLNKTELESFKAAGVVSDDGFTVEGCLGFIDLPGYQLGNKPQSGQTIHFMMLKTNWDHTIPPRKMGVQDTVVPFLYDGHNVRGYIPATLQ